MYQSSYVVELPTTTTPKHHGDTTTTRHRQGDSAYNSCALPSSDLHQLSAAVTLNSSTLLAICQPKQIESAICGCAFTRMCGDQRETQNQVRVTIPTAVYAPSRLPAAERQKIRSSQQYEVIRKVSV